MDKKEISAGNSTQLNSNLKKRSVWNRFLSLFKSSSPEFEKAENRKPPENNSMRYSELNMQNNGFNSISALNGLQSLDFRSEMSENKKSSLINAGSLSNVGKYENNSNHLGLLKSPNSEIRKYESRKPLERNVVPYSGLIKQNSDSSYIFKTQQSLDKNIQPSTLVNPVPKFTRSHLNSDKTKNSSNDHFSISLSPNSEAENNIKRKPLGINAIPYSELSKRNSGSNYNLSSTIQQPLDSKIELRENKQSLPRSVESQSNSRKYRSSSNNHFSLLQSTYSQIEKDKNRKLLESNAMLYSGIYKQNSDSNNLSSAKIQQSLDLNVKLGDKKLLESRDAPNLNIKKNFISPNSYGPQFLHSKIESDQKGKPQKSSAMPFLDKQNQNNMRSSHVSKSVEKQSLETRILRDGEITEKVDFLGIRKKQSNSSCVSNFKRQQILGSKKLSENMQPNASLLSIPQSAIDPIKQKKVNDLLKLKLREKLEIEEPPENFRSIPVLPHAGDFLSFSPFFRPNVIDGRYQDTEHYLDVQFRLLREDYMKSLRDGIVEYKKLIKQGKSMKNDNDVRVYANVCIVSQQMVRSGLIHIAKFSDKNFSRIKWESSKRLMTGSLLCLSEDNFETILFATVAERKIDELKKGFLMLKFEELNHKVLSITTWNNFVVIEINAYFEAYRHNLKALQELDESNFPMKRYIVEVEKKVLKPKYLEQNMTYDMRPLLLPLDKKYINFRHGVAEYNYPTNINSRVQEVNVLNQNYWPTSSELNLNPSQYEALKTAVTKEFAIIQGPPGTGKTYTSLRIVQLLLHNISKWTTNAQSSTILVVCYTNHALDQFLEGLTMFTNKIVRIGGQGKNEALKQYQLCNLKKNDENKRIMSRDYISCISNMYSELNSLETRIGKLNELSEKSKNSILTENELREVMNNEHFLALREKKYETVGNLMYSWLGANQEDINDSVFEITVESISKNDLSFDIRGKRIVDINSKNKANSKNKVQQQWIKLLKRECMLNTLAVQVTEILNFCDPLTSILAEIVQNVWEIDITMRWKLYKYWVECFIKSKHKEYSNIARDFNTEETSSLERFRLQMLIKSINQSMETAFSCLLDEFDLKDSIPHKHFVSLRGSALNKSNIAPVMNNWLQLKVENQSLIQDRVRVVQNLRSALLSLQNELGTTKSNVFVECDDEEYAEVGDIEAQRKIDSDEYADVSFDVPIQRRKHEKNLVFPNNWQIQGGKKTLSVFIKNKLHESAVMSEKEINNVDNLWNLSLNKRWELYKYWVKLYIESKQEEKYQHLQSFSEKYKHLQELHSLKDIKIAKNAHVVGMTTTGAAKYRHIIEGINPAIVVVEEAAEILESHVITSLSACTQHVILIGDHQQLKPNPTVHMLAVKYNLNVSLFERMVKNGLQFQQLRIQHRMRPDISALLVPHIYEHLENHESVYKFENIRGVSNNVYFIAHNFHELQDQNSKTKVNQHEAKFLIQLCRYFIQQNYKASQITILTTYSGQVLELTKLAKGKLSDVRITSVDNYQGEENEIILVSFVRSNEAGAIGFLKVSNRVCVALSRAKKGLFCIGNFSLLADASQLWKDITYVLEQKDLIGVSLELKCQNHPKTSTFVKTDKDFEHVPDGGCSLICESSLPCGHKCPLKCHPFDREHKEVLCHEPCTKFCEEGHLCRKKCSKKCGPCPVRISKIMIPCNHEIMVDCYRKEEEISCPKQCERLLPCKHRCTNTCGEECTVQCLKSFSIKSPYCGHKMKVQCFRTKDADFLKDNCRAPCGKLLSCQHVCKGSCGKCKKNLTHFKCREKCGKILPCGHHCLKLCGEKCTTKCEEMCLITSPYCGHDLFSQCYRRNDSKYLREKCLNPCNMKLQCQHTCSGTCSSCHQGHVGCNKNCDEIFLSRHNCQYKTFPRKNFN